MRSTIFSILCINLQLLSYGGYAFTFTTSSSSSCRRNNIAIYSSVETPATTEGASSSTTSSGGNKNKPNWEVKQHLYGLDMINEEQSNTAGSVTLDADGTVAEGDALPLPETYITCGQCKSLFAISEDDLGNRGKGCRVKCSVCGNSWFQSRERLFDIPKESHDLLPADKSDLDRVARNLAKDLPAAYMGDYKLYVGNLDFRTTPNELFEFFEASAKKEGSVCDVSIVKGPDGRSRGFAFVTFYDREAGRVALENGNGAECNGRELAVREPNN